MNHFKKEERPFTVERYFRCGQSVKCVEREFRKCFAIPPRGRIRQRPIISLHVAEYPRPRGGVPQVFRNVQRYCWSLRNTSPGWNRKTFSKPAFHAFHRLTTTKIALYGECMFFLLEMIHGTDEILYITKFPHLRYRQSAPRFLTRVFNRFYLRLKSSKRYG